MFAAGDDAPVAALCRARQGAGDHSGDSNGDEHARFDEREAGLCGEFGGGVSVKTYGRLRYGNFQGTRVWGVSGLEPHVAIAFKRLFAKIQTRKTTHILSDTDDTRADLEWFMQRYPLTVRATEREILAEGAARAQRIGSASARERGGHAG